MVILPTHTCVTRPQWVKVFQLTLGQSYVCLVPTCKGLWGITLLGTKSQQHTTKHERYAEVLACHYNKITWASWCRKSPASRMFVRQVVQALNKEIAKGLLKRIHWWLSPRKGPITQNWFILWWLLGTLCLTGGIVEIPVLLIQLNRTWIKQ